MSSCHCRRACSASSPLSEKILHSVHCHGRHRAFNRNAHSSNELISSQDNNCTQSQPTRT
uniref:Uncharacterized protein n=1 Tax=Arundo donax TaxID=35708 RepID=A0A0A8XTV4_ARUDO